LAEPKATFEHGDGLVEVSFVEVDIADTEARSDQLPWLIGCLRYSEPFFCLGYPLREFS
jgi:hypothetical protein